MNTTMTETTSTTPSTNPVVVNRYQPKQPDAPTGLPTPIELRMPWTWTPGDSTRRQATDLAPEFAQDARVLNRLTGHLDSATRERVYQDPQNELVRARAAKAWREMRQYLGKGEAA
jgi:hypothetical protein